MAGIPGFVKVVIANYFIDEDALVDTGFTGFLMLPESRAFGLGIVPSGTGDYTLADDSLVTNYLGEATVTIRPPSVPPTGPGAPTLLGAIEQESITGIVVMCGGGALVGMEFIRRLDKCLMIGPFCVLLDLSVMLQASQQAQPPPPAAPPNAIDPQRNKPVPKGAQQRYDAVGCVRAPRVLSFDVGR